MEALLEQNLKIFVKNVLKNFVVQKILPYLCDIKMILK